MCFDLNPQFLQMLYDGAVDGATEVSMLICYSASLVTDLIVDVL